MALRKKARKKQTVKPGIVLAAGPRKQRKPGPPDPVYSTHKKRTVWFQARASWPLREADVDNLIAERIRAQALPAPPAAAPQWVSAGPTNIGGRCTSLACHPTNPDIVWIGSAGGGVWKSTDGGASWTALWHSQDSLNVGALAVDAKNPDVVYCATGEADLSADSYPGVGVYRSQDGGSTWNLWASARQLQLPRRIGVIAVDPFDSNHIRIGGVRHRDPDPSGMFVTRDGGATWKAETFVSANPYFCHSVVFHPTKQAIILATFDENGSKSGIWRTKDGGATWAQLTKVLPAPDQFHRASLAIAPSNPDWIYAIVANAS